jgi:hypothetical protein
VVSDAHVSDPVHVFAPPLVPGQHAWPAAPHVHVPLLQVRPPVHVEPPQHTWLAPPHWHVPLTQARLDPQGVLPLQHAVFCVPHATQVVPAHS